MSNYSDNVAPDAGMSKGESAILRRCYRMLKSAKSADKRWRDRALECLDFYFGKQWSEADARVLRERGQPVVTINRVRSSVRLAIGTMAANPFDWVAKPVGLHDDDMSELGTAALKFVSSVNNYPAMQSKIFFWGNVYGVGYAYAGFRVRDPDPRTEIVQNRILDPREVRLDPESREADISDAGFVVWSRRVTVEAAQRLFPKHAKKLSELTDMGDPNLKSNRATWVAGETPPPSLWDEYSEWNQFDSGDDPDACQYVIIHELWERAPKSAWLLEFNDGNIVEFDPDSPEGQERLLTTYQDGKLKRYYEGQINEIKQHIFCGNMLLHTGKSPYDHGRFPIVPYFYERDHYGDPYSMVESQKDLQREVNARKSRDLYEMSNTPLVVDPESLMQMGLTADEAAKAAKNPGTVWVSRAGGVSYLQRPMQGAGQFNHMQDAKNEMDSVVGINAAIRGDEGTTKSGVARQADIQQSQTIMRPGEEGFRLFHKLLGEINLQLIQQAHTEPWIIRISDDVGRDKFIQINEQQIDPETGTSRVMNDINQVRFEVEIDATPWSSTIRDRSSELLRSLAQAEEDPSVRKKLNRMALEVSDMPQKPRLLAALDEAEEQAKSAPPVIPQVKDIISIQFKDLPPDSQNAVLQQIGLPPSEYLNSMAQQGPMPMGMMQGQVAHPMPMTEGDFNYG